MKMWKKCLVAALCLCAVAWAAVSVSAAGHISGSASGSSVTVGQTVTVTVSLAETTVSSLGAQVTCDGMEVTSGQWLQSGLMASFDMSKNKGVFSPGGATAMSGEIFQVTLKTTEPGTHTVSVRIIGKNGGETVFEETVTKTVSILCRTHSFGDYEKNADSHWKTCTACGHKDSGTHTWDAGTVTVESSCTQSGERTYSCTLCRQTRTEQMPALDHTESGWIVDREAQIGAEGSRHTECTVCHTVLKTEAIPALDPPATEPEPTEPEPTEPEPTEPEPTEPEPTEPEPTEPAPTEPEEVPTEPDTAPVQPETPATEPQTDPTEPSAVPSAPETEPVTEETPAQTQENTDETEPVETDAPPAKTETKPVENSPETTPVEAPSAPADMDPMLLAGILAAVLMAGIVIILVLRKRNR